MFLEVKPEIFPILFPLLCIFVPVIILLIVVLVKKAIKEVKRSRKLKATAGFDYEVYFGGSENIENIEIKMSRVNVTVKDVDQVNFDKLKELNMGILVVGNVVKCASSEFVSMVENNLNK